MNIRVFPVFHSAIDERLIFDAFDASDVDRYFTLYGVNESRPRKLVTRLDGRTRIAGAEGSNALLEYQLNWYDGFIQSRGFMETSCYVHLMKNRLHEAFEYIGVAQYDMRWTPEAVAVLRRIEREPAEGRNTVYGLVCG